MPVAVFVVGCALHTESFSFSTLGNMILISIGVAIASYGTHPCISVSSRSAVHLSVPLAVHVAGDVTYRCDMPRPQASSILF